MSRSYLRLHIFVCVIAVVVATHVLAQVTETPLQCNGDSDAIIAYGNSIQCSISTLGDLDNITFEGTATEIIVVGTQKLTGDGTPLFRILGPDGTLLADWYFLSRVMLTQTGTHTILMAENAGDQLVDYLLTLERIQTTSPTALPIQYGQTVNERLVPIADLDPFYFFSNSGDTILVTVLPTSTEPAPVFQIFDSGGNLLADWTSSTQVTLTQTGSHTILVAESFLDQIVDYSLSLQCLSGVCSSTTPPPPPPEVSAFAGTYEGTFTGDDSGTFTVVVDTTGNITGTGESITFGIFDISGTVDPSGNIELVAGNTSIGAIFSGTIAPDGTVSGTWESTILFLFSSGTFSGSKTGP